MQSVFSSPRFQEMKLYSRFLYEGDISFAATPGIFPSFLQHQNASL